MQSPSRTPSVWLVLSSALAAAALNLATATLDHPRALESLAALGLPLLAGFAACLVLAALVFGLGALGKRFGLAEDPLRAGLVTWLVLGAALAPLVEVGLRDTTSERAAALLACATGFVLCAAFAVAGWTARATRQGAPSLLSFLPLGAFVVLLGAWTFEYRVEGNLARAGVLLALTLALAAGLRSARSLPLRPVLAGLVVWCVVHGAIDALCDPQASAPTRTANSDRPPVVLLTVDTLRADRVLGDGPARVATPAIDALLADSFVFDNARSAAPWTKPSLSTLLTGLSPLVHGMTNRRARLPDNVETLAERLRAAGYRTAGIGLNAHLERAFRLDQGFDDYRFPARPDYGIALGARVLEHLAPARFPELFPSTTAIADVAVDWLEAHANEPLFLWVHVLDPHWPYEPPAEWVEHPTQEPRRWGDPTMVTNVQAGNTKPGEAERQRVQELYAGEIRYVDANLARIRATLERLGLYQRALVVFASDHGEEFWEHGRYEHGHTLYDEVLRVPLAFKLPGETRGARSDLAVSTEGLVPTVLDVLGLAYDPEQLSSRSLKPFWSDPEHAEAQPLFSGGTYYFGEKRAVVFDGHKLVLEADTQRVELYDLSADPHELHSLSAAQPERVRRGMQLLEGWFERCAALRATLGVVGESSATIDDELQDLMRDLGYSGTE